MRPSSEEKISHDQARKLFLAAGRSISEDIKIRSYDQPAAKEVSFLAKEPKTEEEIAENIFEQLRSIGVNFSIDPRDNDPVGLMAAYLARRKASNNK